MTTVFSRIIAISGFTLSSLLAQEEPRKIADADGDGWCDLWCDLFKEIEHRDRRIDSDGDGFTDYQEMLRMRNPYSSDVPPTEEEIARAAALRVKSQEDQKILFERRREMLAPIIHSEEIDDRGRIVRTADLKEERRIRAQNKIAELREDYNKKIRAALSKAKQLGLPERVSFPNGGAAVLSEHMANGAPVYTQTRSSFDAAESISLDRLWPGGSSGFDLTGQRLQTPEEISQGINAPQITLGIWEVENLLIDHPEFVSVVETIDSASSTSGWNATTGGFFGITNDPAKCQEGPTCLDLRRSIGQPSTTYYRQQPNTYDFTGKSVAVWFFVLDKDYLSETVPPIELRFGTDSTNYWAREFALNDLVDGWNLLIFDADTATAVVGNPDLTDCSYTAIEIDFIFSNFQSFGNAIGLDFWRLVEGSVRKLDGGAGVGDHSTHTTGLINASGVEADVIGMAYSSKVHSRDSRQDIIEMAEVASSSNTENIFASNHSYGLDSSFQRNLGWRKSQEL